MKFHGITLEQGSNVSNLTVASGTSFPTLPDEGELFFRSDEDIRVSGLYLYVNGSWDRIASTDSLTVPNGLTLPQLANEADVFYLNVQNGGDPAAEGLYIYRNSVWVNLTSGSAPTYTITGDVTGTIDGGTDTLTLANTTVVAGSYGSGAQTLTLSVDGKGRLTSVTSVTATPAFSSITGRPTTLAGYGITDAQPADPDLSAVASLTGTGLARRTGEGTWELDASTYLTGNQAITLTGDATGSGATNISVTLATVNDNTGSFGSASQVGQFTVNGKGLVTAATSVSISLDASQVTSGTFADARISQSSVTQHQAALTIGETQITDGTILARLGANETITGNWSFNNPIVGAEPSSASHLATKQYVDNALTGLTWKVPVRAATTANITLSGTQTIDGVGLQAGDRVLVKNQDDGTQNGVYVVAPGAWQRATDFDSTSPIDEVNSAAVFVQQGSTQADTGWTQTAAVTTVGSQAMVFVQFSASGVLTAGSGLVQVGNAFNVGTASTSRIVVNTDDIDLATVTQTTGGTFSKLTVDSYGRVTQTAPVTTADLSTLVDGTYVNVSGDTMTGLLRIGVGGGTNSADPGIIVENGTNYGAHIVARNINGGYNALSQAGDTALIAQSGGVDGTGGLVIGLWSASAKGIRIAPDGNVGIGTASPTARLHVVGGSAKFNTGAAAWGVWQADLTSSSFMVFNQGGTTNAVGYIGTDGGGIISGGLGTNFGVRAENDLILMTGAGANSAVRMLITSDGNVGIGTASPATRLDLGGGSLTLSNTTISGSTINLYRASTTNFAAIGTESNGGITFVLGTQTPTEQARLAPNGVLSLFGNVASTSTTSGTLVVTGGAGFSGTVHAGGFVGSLTGNATTATDASASNLVRFSDGTGFAGSSNEVGINGGRGSNLAPNTYARQLSLEFKNSTLFGTAGGHAGLMTIAPWTGTTASGGDSSYQLLFSPNAQGSNSTLPPTLMIRAGIDTTWGAWSTMLHSANFNAWAPTLTGTGASGTWGINITGNAATASSVAWTNVSGRPTTIAGLSGSDSTAADPINRLGSGYYERDATTTANGWPVDGSWWHLHATTHSNLGNNYSMQLAASFFSNDLRYRSTNASGTTAWSRVLLDTNYTNWAPSLTGTGASGTWGINITGSAATLGGNAETTYFRFRGNVALADAGLARSTGSYQLVRSADTLLLVDIGGVGGSSPRLQLTADYRDELYFRVARDSETEFDGVAYPGHAILASNNFTSYAPSLTGTGASGTWGINITGSAGSATTSTSSSRTGVLATWDGTALQAGRSDIPTLGGRSANLSPINYDKGIFWEFKDSAAFSASGAYTGLMTLAPFDGAVGSGGGSSYQLSFSQLGTGGIDPPQVRIRAGLQDSWGAWSTLLHSANFNTWAPTLTGTGASGTWGINITGSAGSLGGVAAADFFQYQGFELNADTMGTRRDGFTYANNAPFVGPIFRVGEVSYSIQFNAPYNQGGQNLAFRTRNGDTSTFNSWIRVLTSSDFSSWAIARGGDTVTNVIGFRSSLPVGTGSRSGTLVVDTPGQATDAATMTFWKVGHYAVNMGLDGDNVFRLGGWSDGANVHRFQSDTSGNFTVRGGLYPSNGSNYLRSVTGLYGGLEVIGLTNSYTGVSFNTSASGTHVMFDSAGNGGHWDSTTDWHIYWSRANACLGIGGAAVAAGFKARVNGALWVNNEIYTPGTLRIQNTSPTITLQDTNHRAGFIHVDEDVFYILRGGTDAVSWDSGPNGRHPMTLNLASGNVEFSGDVAAFSDIRLKKNVEVIDNALAKVEALRGVTFDHIEQGRGTGLIAQELQEVLPEAVHTSTQNEYLTVAYGNTVGLLVEAIKELSSKVKELEAKLAAKE